MSEVWKDIEGFDGDYQVSNLGNVRSKAREYYAFNGVAICKFKVKEKILKQQLNSFGYPVVSIRKKKQLLVSRLVAAAFIPNPENKPCVNHISGVKTDNRVENLEWATYAENNAHAIKTGLRPSGERYPHSKLTDEIVREIRKNHKPKTPGTGCKVLARKYGVHHSVIQKIINKEMWKYVE